MKKIILKPGEERRILAGHPWVYQNEIAGIKEIGSKSNNSRNNKFIPEELTAGECADVEGVFRGKPVYLGRSIVNPASQITARIYSRSKEGLDKGFFKRRIREAMELRSASGFDLSNDSMRIVFGEADGLPGLIIDRFIGCPIDDSKDNFVPRQELQSWFVIQFLSYGMDCRRDMILAAMEEIFESGTVPQKTAGIIEKSAPVRELEGLPLRDGILSGGFPAGGIVLTENGFLFLADLLGGQKTGHYLDQRINRRITGEYAARLAERFAAEGSETELRILDCFCYTGGFAITAAANILANCGTANINKGTADIKKRTVSVTAVDASSAALELARKNANLNGVSLQTLEADVFDYLRQAERRKEKYNLIILDPPAFAKSHASLESAVRGYKEINLRAIKLLAKGGILVSCSCSHAMDEFRFKRMIADAAADAQRRLIQMDFRYQPPDHPVLAGYDESLYLKCGFYRAG